MSRFDVFLAVLGGINLQQGITRITEAVGNDDALGTLWGCLVVLIGVGCVSFAYSARRDAEREKNRK